MLIKNDYNPGEGLAALDWNEVAKINGNLNLGKLFNRGQDFEFFGDSIGAGATVSSPELSMVNLISSRTGLNLVANHAVSGSLVADQADFIFASIINQSRISGFMLGTNDSAFYTTVGKIAIYKAALFATLTWLAIVDSDKIKFNSSGITYSGTWSNSSQYASLGKVSTTNGSTATISLKGSAFIISYSLFSNQITNAGVFTVTVDGTLHSTHAVVSSEDLSTQVSRRYVPQGILITGLPDINHTIVIAVTSPTNSANEVHLHYIAAIRNDAYVSSPEVYVGTTATKNATGYTNTGSTPTLGDTYKNTQIEAVTALAQLGLNVCIANIRDAINPATDLASDGLHWNDIGHSKGANAFISVINGISKASVKQLARHGGNNNNSGGAFTNFDADTISTDKDMVAGAEAYSIFRVTDNGTGFIGGYNSKLSDSNEVVSLFGGNSNAIFHNPLGVQIFAGNVVDGDNVNLPGGVIPLLLTISKNGYIFSGAENYNIAHATNNGTGWIAGYNVVLDGNVPVSRVGGNSNCTWYRGNGRIETYSGNVSAGIAIPLILAIGADGTVIINGDANRVAIMTDNGTGWMQGFNVALDTNTHLPMNLFGGNSSCVWYRSNGAIEYYNGNVASGNGSAGNPLAIKMSINADGTFTGLPKATFQAHSTATTVAEQVIEHNALIDKFISAGLMAST